MCDARPDDAASAPTRAVREVDEPAVYPDTARHVVAVAIAPPAEHDMSVGTRIRRERAPRFALDPLSQSPFPFATRRRVIIATCRLFTRAMWARNRRTPFRSGQEKQEKICDCLPVKQKKQNQEILCKETRLIIHESRTSHQAPYYSSRTESSTANPAATPPSSLVAAFVRSRWPPCALRVTVSPTRTYPP